MTTDNCIINVTELSGTEDRVLRDVEKRLRKRAKELVDNPNDEAELSRKFDELVDNQISTEINRAAQRERQMLASIQKRKEMRRDFENILNQTKLNSDKKRYDTLGAAAETLNNVGEIVERHSNGVFDEFLLKLEDEGLANTLLDNANARSILLEIGEINKTQDSQPGISENPNAQRIARIYQDMINEQRAILADMGVPVADLEGRTIKSTLSARSLMDVKKEQFIEDFLPRLDRNKTLGVEGEVSDRAARQALSEVYDNITKGGAREQEISINLVEGRGSGVREADRIAESREVHLKTVDDMQFMAENYGPGTVRETMLESLRFNARNAALLNSMGPDPRNTLEEFKRVVKNEAEELGEENSVIRAIDNPRARDTFLGRNLNAIMDHIDGTSMEGGSTTMRDLQIVARNTASFALLGKLFFASIPDAATFARAQERVGMDVGGRTTSLFKEVMGESNMSVAERQRTAGHLSLASRHIMTELYETSPNSTITGKLANKSQRLSHFTFKYSGGQLWQRALQRGAHAAWSNHMANELNTKTFRNLDQGMQDILIRAGINENDWETLQGLREFTNVQEGPANQEVFIPDSIDDMSDEDVKRFIVGSENVRTRDVREARRRLTRKAQNAAFNFVNQAVIRPDARARSALALDTQAGTPTGFLVRSMTALMSWPYTFTQRALGGELANGSGAGAMLGLTKLSLAMVTYAGIGLAAQDALVENRVRDWSSTDPETMKKNALELFSRAGLGGIYGGMLFSTARGFQPVTLGGPAASVAGSVLSDLYSTGEEITEGDTDEAAARLTSTLADVAPELPLVKPIADELFLNEINEVYNDDFTPTNEAEGSEPFFETN